jgi:hypothetical protein
MRFLLCLYKDGQPQPIPPTRLMDMKDLGEDNLDYYWNRAYCCSICGEVWARWTKDQIDWVGDTWYFFSRPCPGHNQSSRSSVRPGSMILCHTDIVILPREVLINELENLLENP